MDCARITANTEVIRQIPVSGLAIIQHLRDEVCVPIGLTKQLNGSIHSSSEE